MLSSEDKCVADCTVMGFMSQSFPNPRKQGNENLFSFETICFLRQRKIRALYSDNEGPSLQNTRINQKMICFKDQVSYSRNLRCRHLLAVRILKSYLLVIEWVLQTDQLLELCYTGKRRREEVGRDRFSPNNGRNLLSKKYHLGVQLQLSKDAREFLLFVSHCGTKGVLK